VSAETPSVPPVVRSGGAIGRVPGSVAQVLLMARYQFRDYLRSNRFVLMLAIVGGLSAILLTLIGHYRPSVLLATSADYYGPLWGGVSEILVIFAGIIFGGDAIAGEFQNRTGYFLMGLPIKRASVYAGKFLAAYGAALLTMAVYLGVVFGSGLFFLGHSAVTAGLFESFVLVALYLAALLGTAFLFSSLFKVSLYGVIVVLVMFLVGFSAIEGIVEGLVNVTPWFIISWAEPVISYPITGVPVGVGRAFAHIIGEPTYVQGIAVMIGYFVGTTLGGLALFEREEFT
jgi:ABC-2 type transport system permease protein